MPLICVLHSTSDRTEIPWSLVVMEPSDPDKMDIDVEETPVSENGDMDIPDVEMEDDQPTPPMLRLPNELLQIVQRHMTIASFYISLLTCKRFLHTAQSREVVVKHLREIPGLDLGLNALSTRELLVEFRKRAKESGHVAGIMAQKMTYTVKPGSMISKAVFTSHEHTSARTKHIILAVPFASGSIQLYEFVDSKYQIRRREELHIRPEDGNTARMDILKMAFAPGSRDLAVLYRQEDSSNHWEDGKVKENRYGCQVAYTMYKLVVFQRLHTKSKGYFYWSYEQETRDIPFRTGPEPLGLALAPNGTACVSWHTGQPNKTHLVWLIYRQDELFGRGCTYDSAPPLTKICTAQTSITAFSLQFAEKGKKLDLFERGHPMPSWTATIGERHNNTDSVLASDTSLAVDVHKEDASYHPRFSVATPFHEKHTTGVAVDWSTEPRCERVYLALGTAETDQSTPESNQSLFVLRKEIFSRPHDCDHLINHEKGRNVSREWTPVALLSGFKQGTSTLGTVLAASPGGSRVAVSLWNKVYLWSFNPSMLLDGALELYFPPRDYNSRKGFGRIRPTLLSHPGGVVHSMLWAGEDILLAVTDKGLGKWDLSCMVENEEEKLSLVHDTWPDNALAAPAPGTWDVRIPQTLLAEHEENGDASEC